MKLKNLLAATFALFIINFASAATFTAVTSGNWSSAATWGGVGPGTNVFADDIVIPSGITVTMDQDVEVTGLLSTVQVIGKLQSTTNTTLTMTQGTITGTGEININALVIGSFGGTTFTGDFTVKSMTNSSVNLAFATLITITDELFLKAGSIELNTGANLTLHQNATIKIEDGELIGSGGLFNTTTSYAVVYVGSSKNTGMELEGSGNVDVEISLDDNNETLTIATNTTIEGTLDHKSGALKLNGKTLTIAGDYKSMGGVMIMADANAKIIVKSSNGLTGGFNFDANNNTLGDIEVDLTNSGKVMLNSNLMVKNTLIIKSGNFELNNSAELSVAANAEITIVQGSILATNGSFSGASSYNVNYTGGSKTTSVELNGAGLNNVNVTLDDSQAILTLANATKVNGELNLNTGTLDLKGNNLEIAGNFNGTASGKIKGNSTSNLTISSQTKTTKKLSFTADGQMLNVLTINIANGQDAELESDLMVKTLTLINGGVEIMDNTLTIDNSGSITGATTSRYVKISGTGKLKMMVQSASYTAFPVGTSSNYSPANLKLNSGTAAAYSINVMNGVYAWGTSGTDFATTRSLVNRTWDVTTDAGANVDLNMKLEWTSAAEVNGFDRTKAFISHYANGNWDVMASASATTTTNGTYTLSRDNITSLSPFSVADANSGLSAEQPLVSITKMYPNPVKDELTYELSGTEPCVINVTDVAGKLVYSQHIDNPSEFTTHTIDFSSVPSGVYFVKVSSGETQAVQKVVK